MPSNKNPLLVALFLFIAQALFPLQELAATSSTIPFTGKVTKDRVRVRLQPSLDSPIIREFDHDEMVVVDGIEEDFYSIRAPNDLKAYVFRTYILDGVVEGNHVNMRLDPSLEGHVIGQLNSGDRVEGRVSSINSKWLEIALPETIRLYISKDYVEKIGEASYMAQFQRRRDEVNKLLSGAYLNSESALKGPYEQIDKAAINRQFEAIINDYPEFEEQTSQARELMAAFDEAFMKKKIAYLENLAKQDPHSHLLQEQNSRLARAINEQQERLQQLETQLENEHTGNSGTMLMWVPVEEKIYSIWAENNENASVQDFYEEQMSDAITIRGTVEPYNRTIKNKPGDYILINNSGIPVAYLYSTKVNLQELVGQEISLIVSERPNNNFAFPAFFVLGTNID